MCNSNIIAKSKCNRYDYTFRKSKKRKRGFTLIEIIVAFAVASILFISIAAFVPLINNLASSAMDLSQVQALAQQSFLEIEGQLRYAQSLNISNGMPDPVNLESSYIYFKDGEIFSAKKGTKGVSSALLNAAEGYDYDLTFVKKGNDLLQLKLTVSKGNSVVYKTESTINIQNLGVSPITGLASGSHVEFTLPEKLHAPVSLIVVNGASTISDGKPIQLETEIFPYNATDKSIVWFVSDTALARISPTGELTPLKNGMVTVTAAANDGSDIKGTKQVFISNMKPLVETVRLRTETGSNQLKINGNKIKILADITPANAENKNLVWAVDNPDYASIDSDGVLTSKQTSNVSVMVTATSSDGSMITATIQISLIK